jgi:acetyl esterase
MLFNKKFLVSMIVAFVVLMVTACSGSYGLEKAELVDPETITAEIVVYKNTSDNDGNAVELKLHVFYPPGHKKSDKTPAIVFFFGGGWVSGTPTHFYPQSKYLASRGMVAICAEYRIKNKHGTTPDKCVKDGKSAMRWVRKHAKQMGINPNKLAAGGGSAGGHVAAATGTLSGFEEQGEDASVSSGPNALVLFNPVFDNGPGGYGHDRVKDYWQQFSPMHNISKQTPSTIVFLGTKDSLIPVATAEKYKKVMEDSGRRCDLHLYKGQPHGFFNKTKFYETLLETDKFLTSLGYLKGQPTLQKKPSP